MYIKMGCAESRKAINAEKQFREAEAAFSFNQLSAREADIAVRRYALDWRLTPDQIARVASDLGLSLKNDKSARHRDFFVSFRMEGMYSALELLLALVLLGRGTQEEKLEIVFESFDQKSANVISERTVGIMVALLMKIALLKTPLLAPVSSKSIETAQYMATLKRNLSIASSALTKKLLAKRASLSLDDFKATARSGEMPDIVDCGALRDFAISVSLGEKKQGLRVK